MLGLMGGWRRSRGAARAVPVGRGGLGSPGPLAEHRARAGLRLKGVLPPARVRGTARTGRGGCVCSSSRQTGPGRSIPGRSLLTPGGSGGGGGENFGPGSRGRSHQNNFPQDKMKYFSSARTEADFRFTTFFVASDCPPPPPPPPPQGSLPTKLWAVRATTMNSGTSLRGTPTAVSEPTTAGHSGLHFALANLLASASGHQPP